MVVACFCTRSLIAVFQRVESALAGSLLLVDDDEVYNSLLLLAPDGRIWRYDKLYPWGWERAYFRPGRQTVVAHTDLGDIGLLICWDVAHATLWRQYAGQVDLLVIASCPPQVANPTYHFSDGETLSFAGMGPLFGRLRGTDRAVFGAMVNEQAAWLGVPAVHTVGCGRVVTHLPNARGSLLAMGLLWPPLLRRLPQANQVVMTCDVTPGCKVVAGDGRVLAERSQAEGPGFALAAVTPAAPRRRPTTTQPPARASWLSYLISDRILPLLMLPVYRRGARRAWGKQMAPAMVRARWTVVGLGLAVALGIVCWGWRLWNGKNGRWPGGGGSRDGRCQKIDVAGDTVGIQAESLVGGGEERP